VFDLWKRNDLRCGIELVTSLGHFVSKAEPTRSIDNVNYQSSFSFSAPSYQNQISAEKQTKKP
jgi:hypothetical protein